MDFHSPGFFTVVAARLNVSIQTKQTKWNNQVKENRLGDNQCKPYFQALMSRASS